MAAADLDLRGSNGNPRGRGAGGALYIDARGSRLVAVAIAVAPAVREEGGRGPAPRCKEDDRQPSDQIERTRWMLPYRFSVKRAGGLRAEEENGQGFGPKARCLCQLFWK